MPPKWTDDKEEMGYDYPGAGNDSDGQLVAKDYGLKDPKLIMSISNKLGKVGVLHTSDVTLLPALTMVRDTHTAEMDR